jgi:hypothetical protein
LHRPYCGPQVRYFTFVGRKLGGVLFLFLLAGHARWAGGAELLSQGIDSPSQLYAASAAPFFAVGAGAESLQRSKTEANLLASGGGIGASCFVQVLKEARVGNPGMVRAYEARQGGGITVQAFRYFCLTRRPIVGANRVFRLQYPA